MSKQITPQCRAEAALKNLFIGDSLAMPVHWYYNTNDIYQAFPEGIRGFHDAPEHHPSSIMSLHSTHQGGRKTTASSKQQVVGEVILKGREQYWNRANTHYHHQMKAGDNTLNAQCARVLLRSLHNNHGHYNSDRFFEDYITFMTADKPVHKDTYAESYHRGFFQNYVQGKSPRDCAAVTHDTASIGALVTIAPIVLAERLAGTSLKTVRKICHEHLMLTHPDQKLAFICDHYVVLIDQLLFASDDENRLEMIGNCAKRSLGLDLQKLNKRSASAQQVVGMKYSSACYIEHAWPSVLFLAYRYLDQPRNGLISNANLGGDNVHRGCVLGVIYGLAQGEAIESLFSGLLAKKEILQEINQLFQ